MKRPEMNAFDPIEMGLGAKVERKVEKAKRPDRVIAPGVVECGETGKMRTEFPRQERHSYFDNYYFVQAASQHEVWVKTVGWEPKPVEKRLPKVGDLIQLTVPKRVGPNRTLEKGYVGRVKRVRYSRIRDHNGFFYPISREGSDWEFVE